MQRSAGNRAVRQALAGPSPVSPGSMPITASPAAIAASAHSRPAAAVLGIPIGLDYEAISVMLRASRSAPAQPPAGAHRIRDERGGGSRAAGYTSLPAPTPPALTIGDPERREGGWAAPVRPTSVQPDTPVSLFPGPGVHDLGPGPTGQERHIDVTPEMSNLIRQGEEEHLLDLEWARHLSYDRAAAAVNAVSASGSPVADSPAAARQRAAEAVRSELPAQLRWRDGDDYLGPWLRAYSRLAHVTIERDQSHWHDMTSAFVLDPAEKRRLGVPVADELTRYMGGPEIGQHPSAPLARARFSELG